MIWNTFLVFLSLVSVLNAETLISDEDLDHADNSAPVADENVDYTDNSTLKTNENSDHAEINELRNAGPLMTRVSTLGDIRLSEEQERTALDFGKYPTYKWTGGIVVYWIQPGDFSKEETETIENAIAEFNWHCNKVYIRPWKNYDDPDYIHILRGSGCWSYVGRLRGRQDLSLGDGCVYKNTIQHELMHAIGFTHTQNRHDRDNHVRVIWDNLSKDWWSQYEKVNNDFIDYGKYDHYSVMHYPWWSPSHYNQDAFEIYDKNINKHQLGQGENGGVTQEDVRKLNEVYA